MDLSTAGAGLSLRVGVQIDASEAQKGATTVKRELGGIASESDATSNALGRIKQALIGIGSVYALKALATSVIEARSATEGYAVRLGILLKSQEEGNKLFQQMADYASRVPFEYEKIMSSATALSGVMSGGVREVSEWIPMIGDLAAAAGLGIEEATNQVIRMYAAGANSADLFRERGVLAMIGFQQGVKYTAEETRQILINAYNDAESNFRGATSALASSLQGLMSMLDDAMFSLKNAIADLGLFEQSKQMVMGLTDVVKGLRDNLRTVVNAIQSVGAAVLIAFGPQAVTAIGTLTRAVLAMNAAMLANPASTIARVIHSAFLVGTAAIIGFADQIYPVNDSVATLANYFSALGEIVGSSMRTAYEYVTGSTGLTAAADAVLFAWGGVTDAIGSVVSNIGAGIGSLFEVVGQATTAAQRLSNGNFSGAFSSFDAGAIRKAYNTETVTNAFATLGGTSLVQRFQEEAEAAAALSDRSDVKGAGAKKRVAAGSIPKVAKEEVELTKEQKDALEKLREQYEDLLTILDPTREKVADLAEKEKILNEAVKQGWLTRAEANKTLSDYKDQIEDGGRTVAELKEQVQDLFKSFQEATPLSDELKEQVQLLTIAFNRGAIAEDKFRDGLKQITEEMKEQIPTAEEYLKKLDEEAAKQKMSADELEIYNAKKQLETARRQLGITTAEEEIKLRKLGIKTLEEEQEILEKGIRLRHKERDDEIRKRAVGIELQQLQEAIDYRKELYHLTDREIQQRQIEQDYRDAGIEATEREINAIIRKREELEKLVEWQATLTKGMSELMGVQLTLTEATNAEAIAQNILAANVRNASDAFLEGKLNIEEMFKAIVAGIAKRTAQAMAEVGFVLAIDALLSPFIGLGTFAGFYFRTYASEGASTIAGGVGRAIGGDIGGAIEGAVTGVGGDGVGPPPPKAHTGMLASDETLAILQKNERVLTNAENKRYEEMQNRGGMGKPVEVTVINNSSVPIEEGGVSVEETPDSRMIKVLINDIQTNGRFSQSMQASFDMNRRRR